MSALERWPEASATECGHDEDAATVAWLRARVGRVAREIEFVAHLDDPSWQLRRALDTSDAPFPWTADRVRNLRAVERIQRAFSMVAIELWGPSPRVKRELSLARSNRLMVTVRWCGALHNA